MMLCYMVILLWDSGFWLGCRCVWIVEWMLLVLISILVLSVRGLLCLLWVLISMWLLCFLMCFMLRLVCIVCWLRCLCIVVSRIICSLL